MIPLTQEEKKLVIFVLSLLLIGLGLDFTRKRIGIFHLIDEEKIKEAMKDTGLPVEKHSSVMEKYKG